MIQTDLKTNIIIFNSFFNKFELPQELTINYLRKILFLSNNFTINMPKKNIIMQKFWRLIVVMYLRTNY